MHGGEVFCYLMIARHLEIFRSNIASLIPHKYSQMLQIRQSLKTSLFYHCYFIPGQDSKIENAGVLLQYTYFLTQHFTPIQHFKRFS